MSPMPAQELDELFISDTPLIDVRAPVEFNNGAFPSAVNLPILNDTEREQIGICYKEQGPDAAVVLGHRLVAGEVKEARTSAWVNQYAKDSNTHLYCFRGGQRSQIASDWLRELGVTCHRIDGGYKVLRRHLVDVMSHLPSLFIVSGRTGTGKTAFIRQFHNAVDLEERANHRGSAFGKRIEIQPAQVSFENQVAIDILKRRHWPEILLEDESRLIGRMHLPPLLQDEMRKSPLLVIEETLQNRVEHIYQEYIVEQWQEYLRAYGEAAAEKFRDYLLGAAHGIRKRLGGAGYQDICGSMNGALDHFQQSGSHEAHRRWIAALLTDYYDPMYAYQLSHKTERMLISGTANELAEWYRARLEQLS